MNNIQVHNFNGYLCKLKERKKEIWDSTFAEHRMPMTEK
jgi:hypothetical protein